MSLLNKTRLAGRKTWLPFLTWLFLAAGQVSGQTQLLRDALGYSFSPGPPPERIISLAPNLTEILFSLGLGDRIIGVTRFCNYPPEAKQKEQVGGIIDPNLEKIASLRPDLILAFRGTPLSVLTRIRSMGLPLFGLNEGETIEELFPLIRTIGQLTGTEKQARELCQQLEEKLEAVEKKLPSFASRPRVLLLLSGSGYWTSGRRGFLTDLIEKAGAAAVTATTPQRWVLISPEEILNLSPEAVVILAPSVEAFENAKQRLLKEPSLKPVPALARNRFFWLDEDTASRFGPRLIQALEELCKWLHPESFQLKH